MADQPQSHPYTCGTCQVAFRTSPHQRTHMQSDWHRYNLKRRIALLPPLTSEVFNEKVLATQATAAASAARASFEKVCGVCERTYYSENSYTNHLSSKKHREKLATRHDGTETESMMSSAFSLGESTTTRGSEAGDDTVEDAVAAMRRAKLAERAEDGAVSEDDDEDDQDDASTTAGDDTAMIPLKCLFCNALSGNMNDNVKHMHIAHGMFIPEQKYLTDLEGLIGHLHEQIHDLHECLFCPTKKYTSQGIQTHMRDKGHCMIAFEDEGDMIEIGQFYDFSSTYSDEDEDDDEEDAKPSGGVRLGNARKPVTETSDSDEEDEDWESEDEDGDSDEAATKEKPAKARKTNTFSQPAYYDEDGLHLASGRIVGHRQFARIFRQNLRNYPTPEERASRHRLTDGRHDSDEEQDLETPHGWRRGRDGRIIGARGKEFAVRAARDKSDLSLAGLSEQQREEVKAMERRARAKAERMERRLRFQISRAMNNKRHFRDPLLQ